MVIEKIKLRNVADLSIDKVYCCYIYFDEGSLVELTGDDC